MTFKLKLTLNHILIIIMAMIAVVIFAVCANLVLSSIQTSMSINESLAVNNANIIDKKNLDKALEIVSQGRVVVSSSLSSGINPPSSTISATPTILKIEILNASGLVGVAKEASAVFDNNYEIRLENYAQLLDSSTIFYKNEYSDLIPIWIQQLEEMGWKNIEIKNQDENSDYDVTLILGGQRSLL